MRELLARQCGINSLTRQGLLRLDDARDPGAGNAFWSNNLMTQEQLIKCRSRPNDSIRPSDYTGCVIAPLPIEDAFVTGSHPVFSYGW
jgi:hypothetical protein